ncbi:helix-turn-helix domain-containing protein [Pseudoclavibacter helvolus]|uniref:helix-turn-helix domain-containing protein n=1 Tax=Pseudoclavibacter helvolus TaxID=255205 RepID=UPI0008381BD5|nr:helix-turn-helix domain-containing protein [Pseudoclavibacter helvolus]
MPSFVADHPDLDVPGAPAQRALGMHALRPVILTHVLARQEPWTIQDLVAALGVAYAPMVRHVNELLALGWIEPQQNLAAHPRYFVAKRELITAELRTFVNSVLGTR